MRVKLKEIADFVNGRAFKSSEWSDQGLPIIRIQNLNDADKPFNYFEGEYDQKNYIQSGDTLLSWSGTPGTSFGCFKWNRENGLLNQHIFKVQLKSEKVDQDYFIQAVNKNLNILIDQAHGGVGLKHITKGKLNEVSIYLPPIEQQKKIAAILDTADGYRQKTKALIAKYDELTQSLFLDMFGDPVTNPKGWERMKIGQALEEGYILKIQDGNHGEIHPKSNDFLKEGTPMIFANNLTNNYLNYEGGHHLSEETVNGLRIGFSKGGDVLLTHKGSIGLSDVVPKSVELLILSPQVTYYRIEMEILNPVYMKFYFLSQYFFRQLEKLGKQSTRAYVGITKQRLLPLIIPEISLQNQFAESVQAIEAQKAQAQESLAKAEDLFNSLLQKAFKGEL